MSSDKRYRIRENSEDMNETAWTEKGANDGRLNEQYKGRNSTTVHGDVVLSETVAGNNIYVYLLLWIVFHSALGVVGVKLEVAKVSDWRVIPAFTAQLECPRSVGGWWCLCRGNCSECGGGHNIGSARDRQVNQLVRPRCWSGSGSGRGRHSDQSGLQR